MNLRISFALWMAVMLSACANSKNIADHADSWQLTFGYTGGATNVPLQYLLLENRQVYRMDGDRTVYVKRVGRNDMKRVQEMMNDMNFRAVKFSERGNITHFITLNEAGDSHTISWTDQSGFPEIKAMYLALFNLINQ